MWWGPDFHPGSLISELEPSAIIYAAYGWHDKHEARNHVLPIVPCTTSWRMSGVDGVDIELFFQTTRLRRSRDTDVHLMTQHSSHSQDECGHWGLFFWVDDHCVLPMKYERPLYLQQLPHETLQSPLDYKEIQPVHSEGDQPWDFFGRNDAKAETPVLWPPHAESWLIGKDPDAGRDWGHEEKGTTEDEMAGWHHWLDGCESEWAPGIGDGQGGLACCNSWGFKEMDTTERLNWTLSPAFPFLGTCKHVSEIERLGEKKVEGGREEGVERGSGEGNVLWVWQALQRWERLNLFNACGIEEDQGQNPGEHLWLPGRQKDRILRAGCDPGGGKPRCGRPSSDI